MQLELGPRRRGSDQIGVRAVIMNGLRSLKTSFACALLAFAISSTVVLADTRTICGQTAVPIQLSSLPVWVTAGTATIWAADGTYLGLVSSNPYASESILNNYGSYGSEYQANSIFNAYGTYGGLYGSNSACNSYASSSNVPYVLYQGVKVTYLTINSFVANGSNPVTLISALLYLSGGSGSVSLPDLVVTSVTSDATAVLGGSISVSGTISNQGTANAGASRTKIYLSTDPTITTLDIDTTYGCDTGPLVAGTSATCSGTIPLPVSLSAGIYYVGMIADANNQVGESNESNNARAATPTLQVSAAIASQTITFGSAPSITVGGTGTISATATSSLAVTFSSTTAGICTVSGSTVTGISAGTCTIAANQAGNSSYAAAPQITQSFSITSPASPSIALFSGWNLVGNSVNTPLTVATTFGDATKVTSVWVWNATTSKWAFYTPMQFDGGAAYAGTKGYDVLTTINGGEAFWVNAQTAFTAQPPSGVAITSTSFKSMASGWHLISIGSTKTPSAFNMDMSMSPPMAGIVPQSITTLWMWDNAQSKWYFYAPSLEAQGGTVLTDYIASHGYLDFTTANKTLAPGVGFWVKMP